MTTILDIQFIFADVPDVISQNNCQHLCGFTQKVKSLGLHRSCSVFDLLPFTCPVKTFAPAADLSHSPSFDSSNTGGFNTINNGCIPFMCASFRALVLCMLAPWQVSLKHLMLLVPPVLYLLSQVK